MALTSTSNGAFAYEKYDWMSAALAVILTLFVYVPTMAPTVSFWDAGEFIAASFSLGIPHPPGTPLYILVGKFFSLLPITFPGVETVTQRINFMSVFASALAVGVMFIIIVRLIKPWFEEYGLFERLITHSAALAGSLIGAFSFSYWNNAVEAEVYAIAMLIMTTTVWLSFQWHDHYGEHGNNNRLLLIIYALALGVGNHLLCFLVSPGIFLLVMFKDWRTAADLVLTALVVFLLANLGLFAVGLSHEVYPIVLIIMALLATGGLIWFMWPHPNLKFIFAGAALFMLGVSVHAYMPIRSFLNPMIDEGNPENWQAFMDVLLRKQYGGNSVSVRRADFGFQIWLWLRYFVWQYAPGIYDFKFVDGVAGFFRDIKVVLSFWALFCIGLFGAYWHLTKHFRTFVVFLSHFIINSLGLVIYLNLSDHEVRERDYFFVAGYFFFSVWLATGIVGIATLISERLGGQKRLVAAGIAIASIALALIPLKGNYVSASRAGMYVPHDYGYNILASVDDDGLIFTNGDNDTFPLWYVQEVESFRKDVTVMNLSLLNTSWYIKQLRDNPPHNLDGIITWSDQEIESLYPSYLPQDLNFEVGSIKINMKKGDVITVKDLAVFHILKNNWDISKQAWRKPIFFAVTVAEIDQFRPYLKLEGLVFRITMETSDYGITVDKTIENLEKKYLFTGLLDNSGPPLDDNTRKLISNYAAAYSRLAFERREDALKIANPDSAKKVRNEAIDWMKKALLFAPDSETGGIIWRSYAAMLEETGRYKEAIDALQKSIELNPDPAFRVICYQMISRDYFELKDFDSAIRITEEAMRLNPNDTRLEGLRQHYQSEKAKLTTPQPAATDTAQK